MNWQEALLSVCCLGPVILAVVYVSLWALAYVVPWLFVILGSVIWAVVDYKNRIYPERPWWISDWGWETKLRREKRRGLKEE